MDANSSMIPRPIQHNKWNRLQAPVLKRHELHDQEGSQMHISSLVRCKKRRLTKEVLPLSDPLSDKWTNLDANLLGEIFSRLPVIDLFFSVVSVCKSWDAACLHFLFWSRNVLDLSATGAGFSVINSSSVTSLCSAQTNRVPGFFGVLESTQMYNTMATNLMRKLRRIMEGSLTSRTPDWLRSIHTVILPSDLEISDTHLVYIAERTPHVQRLLLLCPSRITGEGFSKAMKMWRHMKELHFGPLKDRFTRFIQEIGRNCENLESLHIHEKNLIGEMCATIIANNLPGLKRLEFEFGLVSSSGLTTLYNLCLNLQEVYFTDCCMAYDWTSQCFIPCQKFIPRQCFRVKWTVGDEGLPKWEVKASPVDAELFHKRGIIPCSLQEYPDEQFLADFAKWISVPRVKARRCHV